MDCNCDINGCEADECCVNELKLTIHKQAEDKDYARRRWEKAEKERDEAKQESARLREALDITGASFTVGARVEKFTGDYQIEGVVRAAFRTSRGNWRYVVEHDPGFLHIYSDANLRAALAKKEGT